MALEESRGAKSTDFRFNPPSDGGSPGVDGGTLWQSKGWGRGKRRQSEGVWVQKESNPGKSKLLVESSYFLL